MNTTIESVKDEVARGRGSYTNWKDYESWIIDHNKPVAVAQLLVGAMEEVNALYHSKKCEEASGNDLPTDEAIKASCCTDETVEGIVAAKWMRQEASKIIAYYQVLLDKEKKAHKDTIASYNKELADTQSQLDELKKQAELLRSFIRTNHLSAKWEEFQSTNQIQ